MSKAALKDRPRLWPNATRSSKKRQCPKSNREAISRWRPWLGSCNVSKPSRRRPYKDKWPLCSQRYKAGPSRSNRSLPLKTPAGKRAVTVMIDSLEAVGGLLNAGDFVDVIAELNVPAQTAERKTV